jgi:hypothetical protein
MPHTSALLTVILGLSISVPCTVAFAATKQNAPPPLHPDLVAALVGGNQTAIVQIITTLAGGDPVKATALASGVVFASEKFTSSNPKAAAAGAAAALNVVNTPEMLNATPQQALYISATAARIAALPAVIKAAPQVVSAITGLIVNIASVPAVFAINPRAALSAMNSAYATASSADVIKAAPGTLATITEVLHTASHNPQLYASDANAGALIAQIIEQTYPDRPQVMITTGRQSTERTPLDTLSVSPSS